MSDPYPERAAERDDWILARRPAHNVVDPQKPVAFFLEEERAEFGVVASVVTIFLTNRECPWRCLMCDLWKNTLTETVPVGAIPAQIDYALEQLAASDFPPAISPPGGTRVLTDAATHQIKLYNSGSFFDPRAIPPEDYPAIAKRLSRFERVIVECHPALVGDSSVRFRDLLATADAGRQRDSAPAGREDFGPPTHVGGYGAKLEVAMGLETAHPEVLEKLNKRMTLDQFTRAAECLQLQDIALRVFVLVKPPFLDEGEALHWARRSIDFAFDCGATVVSLIPTRPGNGALEALAGRGESSPPKLSTLETALDYGVSLQRGRVFADIWDLEQFSDCAECFPARLERLRRINSRQTVLPLVSCDRCSRQGSPGRPPAQP